MNKVLSIEEAAARILARDPSFARCTLVELRRMLAGLGADEQWRARRIQKAIDDAEAIRAAEDLHGYRQVADAVLRLQLEMAQAKTAARR